jgi:hypothetical protein
MPSRRRSRNKSIAGNITDVQKRLRYLETRPAPSQLARKVVSTKNIALRAVEPDVIADAAVVRRTLAPESVISANLSVVGDPDGAAVATENVQDVSITNEKLAGDIEDDKIVGISASKIGPDLLQDDQLDGISTEKLIGSVLDDQIDSVSAIKIGPDLLQDDQLDGISTEKLIGFILDDQIDGISGEKIIGGIDGDLIVEETVSGAGTNGEFTSKIVPKTIAEYDLALSAIGEPELQGDCVDTIQIRLDAVEEFNIANLAISRRLMQDNIIIDRMVNAGAIQTRGLQNLAVSTAKIADLAVTNAKIAGGSVTQSKVAPGAAIISVVQGTGIGVNVSSGSLSGGGSSSTVSLNFGTGSTQVAQGNHTHTSSGVASHTHPVNASISGSVGGSGTHSGHSIPSSGAHSHTVSISSTITTSAPSSLKLKKEISDHQPTDIKNILNLRLKKYKYKNQLRHLHEGINREWMHGYIAEEVQELGFEELLGYDEKGEPASLNYGLLSTLILELVKVQQTEIDSLKEEIQRLKEKI